ncbi:hypothetical protein [Plantactinospora sp. WMMB782]|uniref:hypothetical protein n=1 Tax=Plantactinospora sp. WMMB782 TaxID=3404121 RepID=UPI003B95868A
MTAEPHSTPNGVACPNPSHNIARQHDNGILVGGDVPIAVRRPERRDDTAFATTGSQLASRLAQRLILVYARQGDAVVGFDSDPQLEHTTARTCSSYFRSTDRSAVANLDTIADPVGLVVLRRPPWALPARPPAAPIRSAPDSSLPPTPCPIAAASAVAPNLSATADAEYLDELMPAAGAANLTHVLQIVAATAPRRRRTSTANGSSTTPCEPEPGRRGRAGPPPITDLAAASTLGLHQQELR